MTETTVMYYGITFYYPVFLSEVRGMTASQASSITSVVQIACAAGNLAGGATTIAVGKRKALILPTTALSLITLAGLFAGSNALLLVVMMFLFGFCYSFKGPAAQTSATEVEGMTPAMASGANFMLYGFGSVASIVISPVLSGLSNMMGLEKAMPVFCIGLTLISIGAAFTLPETGPGKAANDK